MKITQAHAQSHAQAPANPGAGPRAGARGRLLAVAVLFAFLTGCALFYSDPTVRIADVRVVGMGFTGGTAEVVLMVENPNRFALDVHEFRYLLEVSEGEDLWAELAAGTSLDTVRLEGRAEKEVVLSIPFQLRALGSALRAWMATGEIPYRVEGEVRGRGPLGGIALPFRSRGTVTP